MLCGGKKKAQQNIQHTHTHDLSEVVEHYLCIIKEKRVQCRVGSQLDSRVSVTLLEKHNSNTSQTLWLMLWLNATCGHSIKICLGMSQEGHPLWRRCVTCSELLPCSGEKKSTGAGKDAQWAKVRQGFIFQTPAKVRFCTRSGLCKYTRCLHKIDRLSVWSSPRHLPITSCLEELQRLMGNEHRLMGLKQDTDR